MRRVCSPDGRTWSIRRRWIPHRRGVGLRARFTRAGSKRRAEALGEHADLGLEGVGENLIIGLILAAGVVLLVLFGFRAAGLRVDEIAAAVASGGSLPEPDSADVPVDVAGSPNRMGGPTYDRR